MAKFTYNTMFVFRYNDPKTPNLPKWDKRPMVIPLYITNRHLLGINFHWLKIRDRFFLMTWIQKANKKIKDPKKIARLTYNMIKRTPQLSYVLGAIRKYMVNRAKFVEMIPKEKINKFLLIKPKYFAMKTRRTKNPGKVKSRRR